MTAAEVQLWQLSSSSSLAITAQLHQQRSNLQPYQLRQPCSRAALQPCSHAALQPCSHAALQPCSLQPCSLAAMQLCSFAAPMCSLAAPGNSPAASQPFSLEKTSKSETPTTALQPSHQPKASMSFQNSSFAATSTCCVLVLHVQTYRHHQYQNVLQCCIWYTKESLQGLQ